MSAMTITERTDHLWYLLKDACEDQSSDNINVADWIEDQANNDSAVFRIDALEYLALKTILDEADKED